MGRSYVYSNVRTIDQPTYPENRLQSYIILYQCLIENCISRKDKNMTYRCKKESALFIIVSCQRYQQFTI